MTKMKSFETVYKELEELFIQKLPDYTEKINKEYNDGIILKRFENKKLDDNCIKLPCFCYQFEKAEYNEKDRIIENTVYDVSFKIKLLQDKKQNVLIFWRYVKAINRMLAESEFTDDVREMKIMDVDEEIIKMRIVVE